MIDSPDRASSNCQTPTPQSIRPARNTSRLGPKARKVHSIEGLERRLRRSENADGDRAGYHAETEEWSAETAAPHGVRKNAVLPCAPTPWRTASSRTRAGRKTPASLGTAPVIPAKETHALSPGSEWMCPIVHDDAPLSRAQAAARR